MNTSTSTNVVWHQSAVDRTAREGLQGHRSALLWFTGLSGAGKSTVAHAVEKRLHAMAIRTFVLDGDNVRHGLCADLGFSLEDRHENIRRISEMARLFMDAGVVTLTAFISPLRLDRQRARDLVGEDFIEVFCRCPLEVCEDRDVKGLYKRARAGEIAEFTGISSPYEEPENPEVVVDTDRLSLDECVDQVIERLIEREVIPAVSSPGDAEATG